MESRPVARGALRRCGLRCRLIRRIVWIVHQAVLWLVLVGVIAVGEERDAAGRGVGAVAVVLGSAGPVGVVGLASVVDALTESFEEVGDGVAGVPQLIGGLVHG